MTGDAVDDLVRSFEGMSLEELRETWRGRYGAPPLFRSAQLLARCLAWRVQTDARGGIDVALRRRLRGSAAAGREMETGARIVKEWRGQRHIVESSADGYLYGGKSWKSLSAIARHITGKPANGPRFFGLRSE